VPQGVEQTVQCRWHCVDKLVEAYQEGYAHAGLNIVNVRQCFSEVRCGHSVQLSNEIHPADVDSVTLNRSSSGAGRALGVGLAIALFQL